jgi:Protein of unknown function (DUF4058)
MPSPFPGMNPYLEQADVWQDFHQSFIPLLRQLLAEQVRPKYLVQIAEQICIHELPEDQRWLIGRGDILSLDLVQTRQAQMWCSWRLQLLDVCR